MIDSSLEIVPSLLGNMLLAPLLLVVIAGRVIGRRLVGSPGSVGRVSPGPASPRVAGRTPLTAEEHWQRIVGVLRGAVERSRRAAELHAAAAVQVGAAEHAFDRLLEEIAGVVTLPRPVQARSARVVRLEARPRHPQLAA